MDTRDVIGALALRKLPDVDDLIDEPTMTPGVFYHGSPHSDIAEFEPQFDAKLGTHREIYFSQIPTLSMAVGATTRGEYRGGGRLYEVELVTRNAIVMPPGWKKDLPDSGGRNLETLACLELRDQGYDCIVSEQFNGVIFELAIFDKGVVRYRRPMEPVASIAEDGRASGAFYSVEGLPELACAPGCGRLFSSRERAEAAAASLYDVRQVRADLYHHIYCDQAVWPRMDFDVLKRFRVDSLIDPVNGDVLVLDQRQGQLNRAMRRAFRRKQIRFPPVRGRPATG